MPFASSDDRPAIAITGATGFLGRRVAERLAERGAALIVLGRRPLGPYPFSPWEAEHDADCGSQALGRICTIVHAAAHVPAAMDDPGEAVRCMAVNAMGTLRLLRAARAAGVGRFVLLSTGGLFARRETPVYDDELPREYPADESRYLCSKLAAEALVAGAKGIDTLVIRPSSIYGPASKGGFIKLVIGRLLRDEAVRLYDGGRHTADFVHVDDVADLVARAAVSPHRGFLNAGSGMAHDLVSVVEMVRALLPHSRATVSLEDPNTDRDPTGFAALSTDRAHRLFGYCPRSLDAGLADVLAERDPC